MKNKALLDTINLWRTYFTLDDKRTALTPLNGLTDLSEAINVRRRLSGL